MPLRDVRLIGAELAPLYEQLPPGPCGLEREEIASHQRRRLHAAMVELVAVRGYRSTTIRELTKLAGVSTRTFYELYSGKDDCFLCAYELLVHRTASRIVAAQRSGGDWQRRLRLAFRAFANEVAHEPKAARLALVEAFGAGPVALERMERVRVLFVQMLTKSFEQGPGRLVPPPMITLGIVAGVAQVARARLLSGEANELAHSADELAEWALAYQAPSTKLLQDRESSTVIPPNNERAPRETAWLTIGAGRQTWLDEGIGLYERRRIQRAAMELAARDGSRYLTAARIADASGVSKRRFRELYGDSEQCLLEALEWACAQAMDDAAGSARVGEGWPYRLHRGMTALVDRVVADKAFANVAFVEVFELGQLGLGLREALMRGFARNVRASAPSAQRPSELAAEASVGAAWGILHHHVMKGKAAQLPAARRLISYVLLTPLVGAREAARTVASEPSYGPGADQRAMTSAGASALR